MLRLSPTKVVCW